ncbi:MAG: response regulator [Gammaproteobacteria bacterium]|jgi:DNA-binding response OmpR family regulator|nr:response regulator [Gammaproteobacteria bacterium]
MKLWSLKDIKILVVDDFPAMRSMMRSMLMAYGANNIKEARNGEEALKQLADEKMELVLCDYNLGEGKDGQQVLEEAKERELLPYSSLFIMNTAENTSEMVMGAVEFQPDEYLVKPFNKVVLQMRIRKLQEKKQGLKKISDAIEAKDYQKAIVLCDAAMQQDQKNIFELLKLKGDLMLRISDYQGGEQVYEKVLNIRALAWAQFGLGKVYFYQNRLEEARTLFEAVIADNNTFVTAYDWLAKVEKAMGQSKKSQETLAKAVAISPKHVLRQKALGEVSYQNEDYDVAEKAYKTVVREGRNSIHRTPSDFGGLAKVYVKKSAGKDALKVIGDMKQEYKNAAGKELLTVTLVEGVVQKGLGNDEQSAAALDKAVALFEEEPGNLSSEDAMELAKACFDAGKKDAGSELMKHVVRNNHEDPHMLEQARKLFSDMGMEEEGSEIISGTQKEVVALNNDGVDLAKQGNFKDSIRLFVKAARAMPENLIINLNTAQSIIMLMQKDGVNERYLEQAQVYLNRIKSMNSSNERFQKLMARFHDLSGAK